MISRAQSTTGSPWGVLAPLGEVRNAAKRELVWVSREIEGVALATPGAEIHATLQHVRFLTHLTELVYVRLAGRGVDVHVHGIDVSRRTDLSDLHLHDLDPGSALVSQWCVLVTSRDHCTAMAATETGPADGSDPDRRFDWVTSHDGPGIRAAVATLSVAGG